MTTVAKMMNPVKVLTLATTTELELFVVAARTISLSHCLAPHVSLLKSVTLNL